MRTDVWTRFIRIVLTTGAVVSCGSLLPLYGQQNQDPATPGQEARDKAREKVDSARDTKQDARSTTRDARETARDTAREDREKTRDGRVDSRDTVRDDRTNVREARREIRGARREFIASRIRSGDLGLWVRRAADGLTVSDVAQNGAISQTGLKEGDEIVSINGQPVRSERDLVDRLFSDQNKNQPVQIVINRNGQPQTLSVQPQKFVDEHMSRDEQLHDFGLIVDESNPNHVKVQAVIPRSPAFYAGVRSGDQVTGFNGQRISALADFIRSLAAAKPGTTSIDVNRNNQNRQLDIDVPGENSTDESRTALRPNYQNSTVPNQTAAPNTGAANSNGPRTPADTQPRLAPPR